MTSATAIICYPPPLSLGPSPSSQDKHQQSHCANFFEHGVLTCFCLWLQPKARFLKHYCYYKGLVLGTDYACSTL